MFEIGTILSRTQPRGVRWWHIFFGVLFLTLGRSRIPIAYPEGKDGGIDIKVISGKSHGVESPVRPLGGCWFFHVTMKNAGATMFQDIRA